MNRYLAVRVSWTRWRLLSTVGVLLCVIPLSSCRPANSGPSGEKPGEEKPEWSYHGDTGPAHWGDLDPAFSAAKDGKAQSPIDIVTADAEQAELPKLALMYQSSVELDVLHNGHSVQANVSDGAGSLVVGGETFKLQQFHFHAPSEHLVDGKEFALELHLVHAADDGTLAVVGVFIQEGA